MIPTLNKLLQAVYALFESIPHSLTALLARFSIAATFWQSGQTKIEGIKINFIQGEFQFGWPRLSDTVIFLFEEEYRLPLISPLLGAYAAAFAEHLFPLLILLGLATRLSAFALAMMTLVIQIFVYPSAYALHGVWLVALIYLMKGGAGYLSLDRLLCRQCR